MHVMAIMREIKAYRRWPTLTFLSLGAVCALAGPAMAQDFLSSAPMKGVLSTLGIIAPDRDPIEYHERAPLVVPKTMDLPQPIAGQAADRNADWPVDPDAARRAKEMAESQQPAVTAPENPKLNIATMLGLHSSSPPIQPAGPSQSPYNSGWVPSGVLRSQGQQFAAQSPDGQDEIRPGYEPKRKFLTDPPSGYRRPSDKAAFKKQYGPPVKKGDDANPQQFQREQALRDKGHYNPDDQ